MSSSPGLFISSSVVFDFFFLCIQKYDKGREMIEFIEILTFWSWEGKRILSLPMAPKD